MYRRFYLLVVLRVILLTASLAVFVYIFGNSELLVNHLIVAGVVVAQVVELIRFVNTTNRELVRLFNGLEQSDFTLAFQSAFRDGSFIALQDRLNAIVRVYRSVKIEKEAQYHLLNTMMRQLNVGILAIEGETDVPLMNPAAERLLGVKAVRDWKRMSDSCPEFFRIVEGLGAGGRKVADLKVPDHRLLSIDVKSTTLLEKRHRIVVIQDINTEIEQSEFEAWNKLIRILTHEIMNSVTPISSLTETTQMLLQRPDGTPRRAGELSDATVEDIRFALKTIQKRSDGLLGFADAYRQFSRVPAPVLADVNVADLVEGVRKLMHEELSRHGVTLAVELTSAVEAIRVDRGLVEQVLINLLTNSMHALAPQRKPAVKIRTWSDPSNFVLEVHDNGKGISDKELPHIFVPFYSTRKDGSGIGLSLSKQIMSLHGGTIKVRSTPGEGTIFSLNFRL